MLGAELFKTTYDVNHRPCLRFRFPKRKVLPFRGVAERPLAAANLSQKRSRKQLALIRGDDGGIREPDAPEGKSTDLLA